MDNLFTLIDNGTSISIVFNEKVFGIIEINKRDLDDFILVRINKIVQAYLIKGGFRFKNELDEIYTSNDALTELFEGSHYITTLKLIDIFPSNEGLKKELE